MYLQTTSRASLFVNGYMGQMMMIANGHMPVSPDILNASPPSIPCASRLLVLEHVQSLGDLALLDAGHGQVLSPSRPGSTEAGMPEALQRAAQCLFLELLLGHIFAPRRP